MRFFLLLCVVAASGCGGCSGTTKTEGTPCELTDAPEACGAECGVAGAEPCPAGFYCTDDNACNADCGMGIACASGYACTPDGRCVATSRDHWDVCADVSVGARLVTPRVILIVDQSSSMTQDFGGGGSRWNVLKNFLLQTPDGLIAALQDQVEFGLALYSARSGGDGGPPIGECPMITSVPPALNNYNAIETVYRPADVIEDTPTGDAVDAVLASVLSVPDPDDDPTIFIIATDGEPDRCEELDPQHGQAEAIAAVDRALAAGIRTYMISVGDEVSAGHMQDMANAGVGHTGAPYWVTGDDAGLRAALLEIVGGVLSCEVLLNGTLDVSQACTGTVSLNGRDLVCDDPNGWRALDQHRIEILGDACDELTTSNGATLEASFPCDVVLISIRSRVVRETTCRTLFATTTRRLPSR